MGKIIITFLKYTWLIRVKKDGTHKFNIYNPFGYVILVMYALLGGISGGLIESFKLLFQTITDSVEYKFEYGFIMWTLFGILTILIWLL